MTRVIVDTNLPPALAKWLVFRGHEAAHTSELGLEAASDRAIWRHAVASGACIVTKDEDFVLLRMADPSGARVVWVRIGNATSRVLIARMANILPVVLDKLGQGEGVVEIR